MMKTTVLGERVRRCSVMVKGTLFKCLVVLALEH